MTRSGVSFVAEPLEGSRFYRTFRLEDEERLGTIQDIFTTNKIAVGLRGVFNCTDKRKVQRYGIVLLYVSYGVTKVIVTGKFIILIIVLRFMLC